MSDDELEWRHHGFIKPVWRTQASNGDHDWQKLFGPSGNQIENYGVQVEVIWLPNLLNVQLIQALALTQESDARSPNDRHASRPTPLAPYALALQMCG